MELNELTVSGIIIVPLITGLIETFKGVGLPTKYSTLVAVLLGCLVGVFYVSPENFMTGILVGVSIGLCSSGLYDVALNRKR